MAEGLASEYPNTIYLLMQIMGGPTGARVQLLQVPKEAGDLSGDLLTDGTSLNDIIRMIETKILESQGRPPEPE